MSNRVTPEMRFGYTLHQLGEASGGKIDAVMAEVRTGTLDPAKLGQSTAPSPIEAAVVELHGLVDQLNRSSGTKPRTLVEWYQQITGRSLEQSTPVKHTGAEVSAAIDKARPTLEKLEGTVSALANLGHSNGGDKAAWEKSVGAHHKEYRVLVNEVFETLGPIDTARRAGQLEAPDAARVYSTLVELAELRLQVMQMGLVY